MFQPSEYRLAALIYAMHSQNLSQYLLGLTEEDLLEIVNKGNPIVVSKLEIYFKKLEEWYNYQDYYLKNIFFSADEHTILNKLFLSAYNARMEMVEYVDSLKTIAK
ncbi:hypothetical protein VB264_05415 [Arcicella aquatica]|uniref:Uncharacterized protein n=1 Tax=Arcicella aquatica TaxID=217141 RepID=A0ABU5QJH3_9BACT|nr:hypothetical protein [Arcicella aquatica]MEA5257216.1 hypothetical protein [Arcicella aquatica]